MLKVVAYPPITWKEIVRLSNLSLLSGLLQQLKLQLETKLKSWKFERSSGLEIYSWRESLLVELIGQSRALNFCQNLLMYYGTRDCKKRNWKFLNLRKYSTLNLLWLPCFYFLDSKEQGVALNLIPSDCLLFQFVYLKEKNLYEGEAYYHLSFLYWW